MFTAHSACPTADSLAPTPGTYVVLRPAGLGLLRLRCRLSEAPAAARPSVDTPATAAHALPYLPSLS